MENNTEMSPRIYDLSSAFLEAIKYLTEVPDATPIAEMPLFSESFGGFRPREFTVLCGSTGTGKTTLLANWSASLIKQKVPHYIASVETGYLDFVARQMAALSGINFSSGERWEPTVIERFYNNFGEHFAVSNCYLSLYDNRIPSEVLLQEIKWVIENKGVKIVFLDNLNFFLEITTANQSIVEMDRVIHDFIIFCKNHDVHIVMVMHPKKTINGRVESEFDIKGSSTAVQEAHNVFLFNRMSDDDIARFNGNKMGRELSLVKMRRRGQNTGRRVLLSSADGVKYKESRVCDPF